MKMLYIVEDRFLPFRADVVELFTKQMPDRGYQIDWLMQREPDALNLSSPTEWLGNTVYLTPRSKRQGLFGRILNNLLGMWGDLIILFLVFRNRYDVIQVRDKFFASLTAWLSAHLTGTHAGLVGKTEDAKVPDIHSPLLLHLGIIMQFRHPGARQLYVGEGKLPSDRQAVEEEASRLRLSDAVTVTGFMRMEKAWELVNKQISAFPFLSCSCVTFHFAYKSH